MLRFGGHRSAGAARPMRSASDEVTRPLSSISPLVSGEARGSAPAGWTAIDRPVLQVARCTCAATSAAMESASSRRSRSSRLRSRVGAAPPRVFSSSGLERRRVGALAPGGFHQAWPGLRASSPPTPGARRASRVHESEPPARARASAARCRHSHTTCTCASARSCSVRAPASSTASCAAGRHAPARQGPLRFPSQRLRNRTRHMAHGPTSATRPAAWTGSTAPEPPTPGQRHGAGDPTARQHAVSPQELALFRARDGSRLGSGSAPGAPRSAAARRHERVPQQGHGFGLGLRKQLRCRARGPSVRASSVAAGSGGVGTVFSESFPLAS